MSSRQIRLQLLPEERAVLLKWIFIPEVRARLDGKRTPAPLCSNEGWAWLELKGSGKMTGCARA
jgi:hypothetical protein